jgi:DNA repair exonuclease SbcCD nuclease subunit
VSYSILHIADVHLDMAFAGFDAALADQRRRQLQDAFERALNLARERRVDAVCIAGDLYEDGRASLDRAAYLRRCLGELAPMRVFISPGNHDPFTPASIYRYMDAPENVTIFSERRMRPVKLADDLTLWGCAHEYPLDREPILRDFTCDGPGTHLLLFHGSDTGHMPPDKVCVAPFTQADVERSGAAHAMVGHFHSQFASERFAYPGSPEPYTIAQGGRHTASIVTITGGNAGVDFIDINRTRYVTKDFDVSGMTDAAALRTVLSSELGAVVDKPGEVFCRVRLYGSAAPTLDVTAAALEQAMATAYPGIEFVEDFAAFDLDAIGSEGQTVRAEFVRALRKRREAASPQERPMIDRALDYGLLAFAGKTLAP